MPRWIEKPVTVEAAGTPPKLIEEFVGVPSTGTAEVSVARMRSPGGWQEPRQRPQFREITLVLAGELCVEFAGGKRTVRAGQALMTEPGEWVRYSTPAAQGAEYVAICLPAFTPQSVHREG